MKIEPISDFQYPILAMYRQRLAHNSANLAFTPDDIQSLIPAPPKKKVQNIWDTIPDMAPKTTQFPIANLLQTRFKMQAMLYEFSSNSGIDSDSGDGYEKYLQYPNSQLSALSQRIVKSTDSDDEKVYKIEQWVAQNIKYVSDIQNYGTAEYWSYPTVTLARGKGDCEDGAFLIHSLALHAGVSIGKLRTYGGFVQLQEGSPLVGGHAWTAYKRDSDKEWVEVDWCYYTTDSPLSDRVTMSEDTKYVDDFFYLDATKTVDASLKNRIRKPEVGLTVNLYV